MKRFIPLLLLTITVTFSALLCSCSSPGERLAPQSPRQLERLDEHWRTCLGDPDGAEAPGFDDGGWRTVTIPHNWETYEGYTKKSHGNLHGSAWYRRALELDPALRGKRIFVQFEGVSAYARVWLNGREAGSHDGGRTSFTLDLTDLIDWDGPNELAVRADHPEAIDDLPYVCGGCWGSPNTEGSQPLGIFRPVSLIVTGQTSVEPFGLHCWTPEISRKRAILNAEAETTHHGAESVECHAVFDLLDGDGDTVVTFRSPTATLEPGRTHVFPSASPPIERPHLWSLDDPYLYRVRARIYAGGRLSDSVETRFGFRWIQWPVLSEALETTPGLITKPPNPYEDEAPSPENQFFSKRVEPALGEIDPESRIRVMPTGVRVKIPSCTPAEATVRVLTTVVNATLEVHRVIVTTNLVNRDGTKFLYTLQDEKELRPGETFVFDQLSPVIHHPELWSPHNPYLYMADTRVLTLKPGEEIPQPKRQKLADRLLTAFGIFATDGLANKWDWAEKHPSQTLKLADDHRFFLNGEPVFLNGVCEYEHLLGCDHAFTGEQIRARLGQIRAAGFNALRMAHHPHNLLYLQLCDEMGILSWPQLSAHIYFNNTAFREHFRRSMSEFVRERRNSPSVVLWGLQNECKLPEVFAREMTCLTQQLDPTASEQRKVTTCNGGMGTDWNVSQNWSGTYKRGLQKYDGQLAGDCLYGEYGQWRTRGLHEDGDWETQWSDFPGMERVIPEELFCYTLESKIRLGEAVRGRACGHFMWLLNSHANPGRSEQNCRDGLPPNDIGVVNNKGLLTSWDAPLDAFYLYRANYAPPETEPMAYIVSHTWPGRWDAPGVKNDIVVFSNCDEVELFNDLGGASLGLRHRGPIGTHFEWDGANIQYNTLYAEGRMGGQTVATDRIKLDNLPPAPLQSAAEDADADNTAPAPGAAYLYRVNCGGGDYTDSHGALWAADRTYEEGQWGSQSWTADYPELDPRYASWDRTFDPISGTRDDALLQTFRFGRDRLTFRLPAPAGGYVAELYFIEPYYGIGGGMDCAGWRIFDVAVNGQTILDDFDIWREAGCNRVVKKEIPVRTEGDEIIISFPEVKSAQAVVSAIAIRKAESKQD